MTHRRTATLQVAGLALGLEGPAAWIQRLDGLWRGWLGAAELPAWSLCFEQGPETQSAPPLFEVRPRFTAGACHLLAPGFEGVIHPGQGIGHLQAYPGASTADLAIFVRTCLALQAHEQGSILFHAAGVSRHGQGYAFFGTSGSGKTTAARNSTGALVLNDDLVILRPEDGTWRLAGTPFGGRWLPQREAPPLRALLRLVQAPHDSLQPMGPGSALGELVANSPVVNADHAALPLLLGRWQQIVDQVPVQTLCFRKGPAFWEVIDGAFG